ncbi:protein of unknown function [Limimaricola pyoseonensis]|uniref:Hemolysin-type calcium-binding repeat-containing protein n=2 Tax=Limimaricola pyoseonensis TaxID=521013 RepID=A0A1G7KJJ3_9RHOB|nr:protein of unknown function [Limimaricola pyoseonensis]
MLDLVNRSRIDPEGMAAWLRAAVPGDDGMKDAVRFFGTDLEAFTRAMSGYDAVAPLAWNGALATAAEAHTRLLIEHDTQSHRVHDDNGNPLEPALRGRVEAAGYDDWSRISENVYSYTQSPLHGHAGFVIDWGFDAEDYDGGSRRLDWKTRGDGMQDPAGHRVNILDARVSELGVAALEAPKGKAVGPWVVTQNFGDRRDAEAQLLGVVIRDADGDGHYDRGEGLGGVTITATGAGGRFSTTSWESGGYQMVLPEGQWTVSFSGGGLGGTARYEVAMGAENRKLDGFAADAGVVVTRLVGTAGADLLEGSDGVDQVLIGRGGADRLLAGNGDDLLIGDGFSPDLASDLAAKVFRLYRATLDRDPDAGGMRGWAGKLFEGEATLPSVVQGFTGSAEFRATYGALSNGAFVEMLYNNVLDRASDAGGKANWVGRLEAGASRSEVVLGFSESAEHQNRTAAAAESFAARHSEAGWTDDVYRLYGAALDREPDMAGLRNWSARLADGLSREAAAAGFTNSAEFSARFGAPDNGGFVDLLYRNVLGREADAQGRANWIERLEAGASRAELLNGFAHSREHVLSTAEALKDYMRAGGDDDWLAGGAGDNRLAGGAGADVFAFTAGQAGVNEVLDFEAWDTIRLEGFGHASAEAARAAFRQAGDDLLYEAEGVTIRLRDTMLASLEAQAIEIA